MTQSTPRPLREFLRLWGPVALMFLAAAALTLCFHHPLPYFDTWDYVPVYELAWRGALPLMDLLSPHNGHWLTVPFAVMLVADRLTGMAPWAQPTASLVFMLIGGVALVQVLIGRAHAFGLGRAAPVLAALAGFFWFSLDQAPNWLWGIQLVVFLNIVGAAGVIACLTRQRLGAVELGGAVLSTLVAVYSYAAGVALLPTGLLLIALHPSARRRRAVVGAVWLAFSAVIVGHYVSAVLMGPEDYLVGRTAPKLGLSSLIGMVEFALTFLGGAVGRFSDGVALPAALIGLGGAIWALLVLKRAGPGWSARVAPFLGLIVFAMICAGLTAWGRLGLGVGQALVSRYISFGDLFWIGALGLMLIAALRSGRNARRAAFAVIGFILVLKLGNVANILISKDVAGDHARYVAAAQRIRASYPNVAAADLLVVSTPAQHIRPWVDILARERLSIFRDYEPGEPSRVSSRP